MNIITLAFLTQQKGSGIKENKFGLLVATHTANSCRLFTASPIGMCLVESVSGTLPHWSPHTLDSTMLRACAACGGGRHLSTTHHS